MTERSHDPQTGRYYTDHPAQSGPVPPPALTLVPDTPPPPGGWGMIPPAAPVPTGLGARTGRARLLTVVLTPIVLLALVVLGTAAWMHHAGSGHAPATAAGTSASMRVIWATRAVEGTQSGTALAGSWVTATTVVDARADGMIAYTLATGAQAWSYQTPSGDVGCAMSATAPGGIGVYAFGTDTADCNQLVAVNTATGAKLWGPLSVATSNAAAAGDQNNPYLAVDGTTLAALGPTGTVTAYSLTSGTQLWSVPVPTDPDAPDCTLQGTAVIGSTVYALASCLNADGSQQLTLTGYSAATGAPSWSGQTASLPTQDAVSLWSDAADGVLLLADGTTQRLLAYSVAGGSGSTAPVSVSLSSAPRDAFGQNQSGGQQLAHDFALTGHTLYLQGQDGSSLSAIDLTSGATLWTRQVTSGSVTLIDADAAGVHTVVQDEGTGIDQLVTFSPVGARHNGPAADDSRFVLTGEDMLYLQGDYLVDLPASTQPGSPELLVLTGADGH